MTSISTFYAELPISLKRFIVAGTLTVGVDAAFYALFLYLNLAVSVSKAASLIAATLFAYAASRFWTFRDEGSDRRVLPFLAVYASAVLLNVTANHVALGIFGTGGVGYVLGWLLATAASSTWNYVGLRYVVFPGKTASTHS
jgi:putative flippase GtrA